MSFKLILRLKRREGLLFQRWDPRKDVKKSSGLGSYKPAHLSSLWLDQSTNEFCRQSGLCETQEEERATQREISPLTHGGINKMMAVMRWATKLARGFGHRALTSQLPRSNQSATEVCAWRVERGGDGEGWCKGVKHSKMNKASTMWETQSVQSSVQLSKCLSPRIVNDDAFLHLRS